MDKLRNLFGESFKFKTKYLEIPAERWKNALRETVADFLSEYDSPEDLAITHYSQNSYERRTTKESYLAA